MSKESEKLNGFITGLLIGGVVGSALAMLYTPFTGKKLRKKISNKTDDILDDVNDLVKGKGEHGKIDASQTDAEKADDQGRNRGKKDGGAQCHDH